MVAMPEKLHLEEAEWILNGSERIEVSLGSGCTGDGELKCFVLAATSAFEVGRRVKGEKHKVVHTSPLVDDRG